MEVIAVKAECAKCGKSFLYEKGAAGRRRIYCSEDCRHGVFNGTQTCSHCNAVMPGRKRKFCNEGCRIASTLAEKSKADKWTKIWVRSCKCCGKLFIGKFYNASFCSKHCKAVMLVERGRQLRANGLYFGKKQKCAHCGVEFRAKHGKGQVFCSRRCRFDEHKTKTKPAPHGASCLWCGRHMRRIPSQSQFRANGGDLLHMCHECEVRVRGYGKEVVVDIGGGNRPLHSCTNCHRVFIKQVPSQKTCCTECAAQVAVDGRWRAKKKRASRQSKGSAVHRRAVFERDNWTCRICGGAVRPHKHAANQADEATIDHVIPLAKGGLHCMENVQTACRLCNSLKSDATPTQGG